jgi:hypothetical protein
MTRELSGMCRVRCRAGANHAGATGAARARRPPRPRPRRVDAIAPDAGICLSVDARPYCGRASGMVPAFMTRIHQSQGSGFKSLQGHPVCACRSATASSASQGRSR